MGRWARLACCLLAVLCIAMVACTISSTPGSQTPVSLSILPANPTLPLGLAQSFLAIAKLHDGTSQDVSRVALWTSSNPAVASIDSKGNLKTLSQGSTTVTAAYASLTATSGVTVTPPGVIAVNINPANPSPIEVGNTLQFTASGTMSDGSNPPDITNKVKWASSNSSVADITSGGLAKGDAVGVTLISATYGTGQNAPVGFATLIVNPLLTSINVIPNLADIAESTVQQFSAIGLYNDGSTQDISAQTSTQWTANCTPSGVANVNAGLAKTTLTAGSCTITATSGSVSNVATLTNSAFSLSALAVTPAVPALPIGVPIQFRATGQFGATGPVQDLTSAPGTKWTSSNTSVAKTPTAGKTTTVAAGTTTITAKFGSTTATSTLTVSSATLSSISLTVPLTKLGEGTTSQLKATGKFSDNSNLDLTNAVTWKSSGPAIAVSATGLVTANVPGSATVTASLNAVSATSPTLQVNPETIQSVAITPASASIAPGTTQQFKGTVTFSDKTQQDITSLLQWNSSNSSVATIEDFDTTAGLASAVGAGSSNISAVFGSVNASTSPLTVTGAAPSSLAITANPSMTLGTSQQLKAEVTFNDGTSQDVTSLVTWSSSNISVLVMTSSGMAISSGHGSATVTATFTSSLGSATNTATITVP